MVVVFTRFPSSDCMHAHSQRSDQQELTVEHNVLVGEVVLVLRHEDQIGCQTTYMIPTSLPHACTFLEVSFFLLQKAHLPLPHQCRIQFSVTTRFSAVSPIFFAG